MIWNYEPPHCTLVSERITYTVECSVQSKWLQMCSENFVPNFTKLSLIWYFDNFSQNKPPRPSHAHALRQSSLSRDYSVLTIVWVGRNKQFHGCRGHGSHSSNYRLLKHTLIYSPVSQPWITFSCFPLLASIHVRILKQFVKVHVGVSSFAYKLVRSWNEQWKVSLFVPHFNCFINSNFLTMHRSFTFFYSYNEMTVWSCFEAVEVREMCFASISLNNHWHFDQIKNRIKQTDDDFI